VQRLVERAACGVQLLGEDVDRLRVERERDQHLALVRAQRVLGLVAQRREQLAGLRVPPWFRPSASDERPGLSAERDPATLPGALADLGGGLVQRELIRPRREPALAAKLIELAEDRYQRVIGALVCEVLEIATT
jgi:hypothetical protein